MDGEIDVRSWVGQGSVFSFEIQTSSTEVATLAAIPPSLPAGYVGERRRILVVDDVPENRALLVALLGALDFRVTEVANGWETLNEVARLRPDLVLIDLAMPVLDGWETIRGLRRTVEGANIPIVATSASATAEVAASSRAAGASAFVGKPIQEAVLLQVIAALLQLEWVREVTAPPLLPAAPAG
jgi:CheY-like chemotaxis protein